MRTEGIGSVDQVGSTVVAEPGVCDGETTSVVVDVTTGQPFDGAAVLQYFEISTASGGSWDYGDTAGRVVDKTAPVRPICATAWRPDHERQLLEARDVRVLVIRPGYVYGRSGGITGMWFAAATSGKPLEVVGTGDNHWPMVRVDDLADGYVRAAESTLSGEIFNFADGSYPRVRDMVQAVAEAAAYRGPVRYIAEAEAEHKMGSIPEALALDLAVDATKAARMLDWHPRHCDFSAEAATYLRAWRAAQSPVASDQPRRAA
jgi:nucleoside-diphosphate-sugar epimerase